MTVTTPPRPKIENDRDLERRVADLEALIEEARRRARRRRTRRGGAALLLLAAGVVAFIGFGGDGGGGAGTAATAHARGPQGSAANTESPLGALPAGAGRSEAYAFDPRNPAIAYVLAVSYSGPERSHVFKTTDGGRHWRSTATRGAGWTGDVETLAADPRHAGTLYAGTTVGVYKTVDGGRNWRLGNRGLFPLPGSQPVPFGTPGTPNFDRGNGWVKEIAVDPTNTNVVYAGTPDGLRKSTDGGHSWKAVPVGGAEPGVVAIAIAPTRPETIWAITGASYYIAGAKPATSIYRSTDAGKSWQATFGRGKLVINSDFGNSLAVDPRHPTAVYAAAGGTVLRTTDAGGSWQPITHGLPEAAWSFTTLTVDPQRPGTVYAGLEDGRQPLGIYKTANGGETWARVVSGFGIDTVAVDPARPATIFAAGWPGRYRPGRTVRFPILRSTNSGRTWVIAR